MTVDVILLDLGLPDAGGLEAVRRAQAAAPRVPLVVLTGLDDETIAAQALKQGAQDYLIKGEIESRSLMRAVRYAIERQAMDETLFGERERAQVTLNSIADAVISTDLSGNITFINSVAAGLTGWMVVDAIGRQWVEVLRLRAEEAPEAGAAAPRSTAAARLSPNSTLIRRNDTEVSIEGSIAAMHDRNGDPMGEVMVFRDVSEMRAMTRRIAHSAQHDFLTGLPNRMLFDDRLASAISIAPRHAKGVAVLFLDLDGFKHVNDSLGHAMGDKLLQSVGRRLVECVRTSDTVSRMGGDEFAVLLSEVELSEDAAITARRILSAISKPHVIDQHDLRISASIGISVFPDDGRDAKALLQNADTAMYLAKESGRQGYQFFRPSMNHRAKERQSIEENLRHALARREFAVHYQPKVNLRTGAIVGAEALLRWTHPTLGRVSPAAFIPAAEDCGLMLPIGKWVLQTACEQARAWLDAGLPPIVVSVNVTAMQFRARDFLDDVFGMLRAAALDPNLLELELPESALIKHGTSTAASLRALRARGVRIALDDFGTGFASVSNLRRFPVDTLKIDGSLIHLIGGADSDLRLIGALIAMARTLNIRVVAEGVETLAERDFLLGHQCDDAQGYYFGHPVPPHQFSELVRVAQGLVAS
ncbi:MAG: EAL domain-containing protein [Devosia sp.]|nr:EAL domain-containing protein [Devosia sp.]